MSTKSQKTIPFVILAAILVLSFFVFLPGIYGSFFLDDVPNLTTLTTLPSNISIRDALNFAIADGVTISSRPISMLSFALQANAWPDPLAFKLCNIFIHITNGLLIYLLSTYLIKLFELGNESKHPALILTALWLVHPMHLATVHYVVQRMTLLMSFFVLAGLVLYCFGKIRTLNEPANNKGMFFQIIGIAVGTTLATLCKENGVLLPIYAIAIEFALPKSKTNLKLRWTMLGAITVLMSFYVFTALPNWLANYQWRDFTPEQRLLTEARVVINYIFDILIPNSSQISLFHDDIVASSTITAPISTLISLLLLFLLFLSVFWCGTKYPALKFGVIFFFVGHLIESTIIPLEIRFDHRNYIPLFGILFAAYFLLLELINKYAKRLSAALFCIVVIGLAIQTGMSSAVWGNPYLASTVWPERKPDSLRTMQFAASTWTSIGKFEQAEKVTYRYAIEHPEDFGAQLQLAHMMCLNGKDIAAQIEISIKLARSARVERHALDTLDRMFDLVKQNRCHGLRNNVILSLVDAQLDHPSSNRANNFKAQLLFLKASIFADMHDYRQAVECIKLAEKYNGQLRIKHWHIVWLISLGEITEAESVYAAASKTIAEEKYTSEVDLAEHKKIWHMLQNVKSSSEGVTK